MHHPPVTLRQVHDDELSSVVDQWEWLQQGGGFAGGRWSQEWALAGLAALQRAELALAEYMDSMYAEVRACSCYVLGSVDVQMCMRPPSLALY